MASANDRERKEDAERTTRAGWVLVGVGWEFLSQVIAGLLLGWGVDWLFGVRPWGIVGGVIAGLLVGMWTFIRRALSIERSLGPVRRPPEGWKGEKKVESEDHPENLNGDPNGDPNDGDVDSRT